MLVYAVAGALLAWAIGIVVYALLDDGKEKPEGFETDVEHDGAGHKLAKTDPRYWLSVLAEGLFSGPAAALRKKLGLPQK